MRKLVLKSIKINTITTLALSITTILLTIICIGLILFSIYQTNHYHELLEKQAEVFQQTIDSQLDTYIEVVSAEEIIKTNYPKRNIGKFQLSWYSPFELKKPREKLRTSTGSNPREGRTIAVDPNTIPYGSTVYIEGFGYYIAEDCGGAIKGNRIDIFTESHEKAIQLGRKTANVYILGKKK